MVLAIRATGPARTGDYARHPWRASLKSGGYRPAWRSERCFNHARLATVQRTARPALHADWMATITIPRSPAASERHAARHSPMRRGADSGNGERSANETTTDHRFHPRIRRPTAICRASRRAGARPARCAAQEPVTNIPAGLELGLLAKAHWLMDRAKARAGALTASSDSLDAVYRHAGWPRWRRSGRVSSATTEGSVGQGDLDPDRLGGLEHRCSRRRSGLCRGSGHRAPADYVDICGDRLFSGQLGT